jgi:hypothetical protein
MPLLLTPPHASYPNAHALQSYLMSGLVARVRPDLEDPLNGLALRVAQNREIAGVHYPSDREASERMAKGVLAFLDKLQSEKDSAYASIVNRAAIEWRHIHRLPKSKPNTPPNS